MAGRDLFATEQTQQPASGRNLFAAEQPVAATPQPVQQPVALQPVNIGDLAAQYKSGSMPLNKQPYFEELVNRGRVPGWAKAFQPTGQDPEAKTLGGTQPTQPTGEVGKDLSPRQLAMMLEAESMGIGETFLTGMGEGFTTVGRGVGLIDEPLYPESEKAATEALHQVSPVVAGAGEIIGEAAPFVPLAMATGGLSSVAGRALGTGVVGAAEGGIIQSGKGEDAIQGAGIGGAVGVASEIILPVIGRLGRKVFQRVTGRTPKGALIDAAGKPTQEMNEALQSAGMTFQDLTEDAQVLLSKQKAGADPQQAARAARATESGVPLTKGEITQDFSQQATEAQLLESAGDAAAEPFRQYKLRQSEAIKENLQTNFGIDVDTEQTGQLIQDALTGRRKLLSTQKNELYEAAAENAKDIGGLPIFTDNLQDAIPDADLFEDLAITAPAAMESLDKILTKYGMKDPTQEMIDAGFEATPLTIQNFERFRKTLNAIKRGDQTGAAGVGIDPIISALDDELMDVDGILANAQGSLKAKIKAYHGTPHKVDKFSTDKIGTGEGAQAYGHGLYFAENPSVAKEYQSKLTEWGLYRKTGEEFDPSTELGNLNVRATLQKTDGDISAAIQRAEDIAGSMSGTQAATLAEKDLTVLKTLKDSGGVKRSAGSVYDVELDVNKNDLLDWDKPLSEQSDTIKKSISDKYGPETLAKLENSKWTGGEFYNQFFGENYRGGGEVVSAELSDMGIPGIKYLDEQSRGAGKGTSNVVIFDENMVDIVGENGKKVVSKKAAQEAEKKAAQIEGIRSNLVGARKTVRQLKTEFSPKSIIGRVVDVKKDGVTPITEASKVYSKLVGAASPIEETRRVVKSLIKSGEKGQQAVASLQAATVMDLIDAGFGTQSRKIDGIQTFNPNAFKRRIEKIGQKKLNALFANNKDVLKKLNNIEQIAGDLTPPSGSQPKGSASVILDLANKVGLASISTKIPGGALVMGALKGVAQPVKTGVAVRKATRPQIDVTPMRTMIEQQFPGIASAIGVTGALSTTRGENE